MGNEFKYLSRRGALRSFFGGTAGLAALGLSSTKKTESRPDFNLDKGMHAIITGSGSAMPDPERGNASQAVVVDGTVLQFDCGRRTMDNLMRAGVNPVEVDYIFFTHLHFDHIATYGYYIVSSWIAGRPKPFKVFGPPGTAEMSDGAFQGIHKMDVKFVTQLVATWPEEMKQRPAPELPVELKEVGPGVVLESEKFKVTATETPHIAPSFGMKSLAYRVDSPYGSVAISGDTAPSQNVIELAKGADLLIHECTVPDFGMTQGGKFSSRSGVRRVESDTSKPRTGHTSPSELGKVAQQAGVKKLVATHLAPYTSVQAAVDMSALYYGPRQAPDIWEKFTSAMKKQYDGPVILGEDAMVIKVG
jgi:ribonuclease Z